MTPVNRNRSEFSPQRRTFLKGLGITLSLPWLESLAGAAQSPARREVRPPQRMLLISNNLGILSDHFFPQASGPLEDLPPYLEEIKEFRKDVTIFSGLSHPDVTGGHSTENCFLTGARGPTKSGFRNTISVDQYAAEALGPVTRFPSINLGVNIDRANRSLSWTRDGALLPAEDNAHALFQKLFLQGSKAEVNRQIKRLEQRESILDSIREDARSLNRRIAVSDQRQLEQYFTAIREVEERLHSARRWEQEAKPQVDEQQPEIVQDNRQFFRKFELMLQMARLALVSDSTRIVTLMVDAFATPAFHLGERTSTDGYHNLSHHGRVEGKLAQLRQADQRQMQLLRGLFESLSQVSSGDQRLLDDTMVLFGSNLGDANTHESTNLPILLAGGRFQHGQHLAFRRDHNTPLCNLFVSMLQQMGVETEEFASGTGTLSGLKMT